MVLIIHNFVLILIFFFQFWICVKYGWLCYPVNCIHMQHTYTLPLILVSSHFYQFPFFSVSQSQALTFKTMKISSSIYGMPHLLFFSSNKIKRDNLFCFHSLFLSKIMFVWFTYRFFNMHLSSNKIGFEKKNPHILLLSHYTSCFL